MECQKGGGMKELTLLNYQDIWKGGKVEDTKIAISVHIQIIETTTSSYPDVKKFVTHNDDQYKN